VRFQRSFSKAPWEQMVAYCRALRSDNMIFVTGTTALGERGEVVGPGDAYAQTRRCLEIIDTSLRELGADLTCVVRTRMFVTDIARWEDYGRAHRDCFAHHPPATTMVEISRLIHPDMLIEIEADAIVPADAEKP